MFEIQYSNLTLLVAISKTAFFLSASMLWKVLNKIECKHSNAKTKLTTGEVVTIWVNLKWEGENYRTAVGTIRKKYTGMLPHDITSSNIAEAKDWLTSVIPMTNTRLWYIAFHCKGRPYKGNLKRKVKNAVKPVSSSNSCKWGRILEQADTESDPLALIPRQPWMQQLVPLFQNFCIPIKLHLVK